MNEEKCELHELIDFKTWLKKLKDNVAKVKIRQTLIKMRSGNFSDSKMVRGGVRERRIHYGPGYRIYFGRSGDRVILLLCGGTKNSQQEDIERAVRLWTEYKRNRPAE